MKGEEMDSMSVKDDCTSAISTHLRRLKRDVKKLRDSLDGDVPLSEHNKDKIDDLLTEGVASEACSHFGKDVNWLKQLVLWKWQWLSDSLKSDFSGKRGRHLAGKEKPSVFPKKRDCRNEIYNRNLASTMLSAWRSFVKAKNLQPKFHLMNEPLEKVIAALPWWIRKVGQRRFLERCFSRWHLLALRNNANKKQMKVKPILRHCDSSIVRREHNHSFQTKKKSSVPHATRDELDSVSLRASKVRNRTQEHFDKAEHRNQGSNLDDLQGTLDDVLKKFHGQLSQEMLALKEMLNKQGRNERDAEINKKKLLVILEICNNLTESIMKACKKLGLAEQTMKASSTSTNNVKAKIKASSTIHLQREAAVESSTDGKAKCPGAEYAAFLAGEVKRLKPEIERLKQWQMDKSKRQQKLQKVSPRFVAQYAESLEAEIGRLKGWQALNKSKIQQQLEKVPSDRSQKHTFVCRHEPIPG